MKGIAALIVVALALPLGALPALGQMSDSASQQQQNPTGATAITPGQSESQAAERERKDMPATLETERSAPGNATGGVGGPAVPPYPLEKKKQTRDGQAEGGAGANPIWR